MKRQEITRKINENLKIPRKTTIIHEKYKKNKSFGYLVA